MALGLLATAALRCFCFVDWVSVNFVCFRLFVVMSASFLNADKGSYSAAMTQPPKAKGSKKKVAKAIKSVQPKGVPLDMHHLSPHSSLEIPTLLRSGQAFAYTGATRFQLPQAVGETILLIATNTGTSGSVVTVVRQVGAGLPTAIAPATISTLSSPDSAFGPTSSRAMKCGLSVTCDTPALTRGGRVTFMNGQARVRMDTVPSAFALSTFQFLVSTIQSFPTSQSFDATHFGETREFTCNVVDQVRYADFHEFAGALTYDEFMAHVAIWPGASSKDRPMSTIWMVLSPPSDPQTYTISGTGAYYTRWPLSTVQGQTMKEVPVAPASVINHIHGIGDHMAGVVHTLSDVHQVLSPLLQPLSEYVLRSGMLALTA